MGNYEQLKQAVSNVIKSNGTQAITGQVLQNTLLTIINTIGGNMQFAGVANVNTNPGTPDQNLFWIASQSGTYVNFGNIVLNPGESAVLTWKNGAFAKAILGLATDERVEELIQSLSSYRRGYVAKNNGAIIDYSTIFVREGYVSLMQGETEINYKGQVFKNAAAICFYDEAKTFISAIPTSVNGTVYELKNQPIPSNAKYIRYSNSFGVSLSIYTNVRQIEYMPLSEIELIKQTSDNAILTAEQAQQTAYLVRDKILVIRNDIDQTNLGGDGTESPFFGTLFYDNNTPLEYNITQIIYDAKRVYQNNKLVIFNYKESENKMIVAQIEEIDDAQIGENTIDINLTIKAGQALYIFGNNVYRKGTNNIIGASNKGLRLDISDPTNIKVGDSFRIAQNLNNIVKSIRVIGSYKNVMTVDEVNKLIDAKINQGGEFDEITNYLKGKVLSVTGDSEAAGHTIGKQNSYGNLIAARNGMTINNYAINGRKLITGTETSLVDTYQEIALNSDYILVQIGYNDPFNAKIDDNSQDKTTFKGAFNILVQGLQSRYPKAKIGFIEPYYFASTNIKPRAEWVKERCEFYHIQCIDGTANSGLRYDFEEQAEYFIDSVHLTILGHERMSYIYEQFMRGL
jgi:hypothetical protein